MGYIYNKKEREISIILKNEDGTMGIPYGLMVTVDINNLNDEVNINFGSILMIIRGKNLYHLFLEIVDQRLQMVFTDKIDSSICELKDFILPSKLEFEKDPGKKTEIYDIVARTPEEHDIFQGEMM